MTSTTPKNSNTITVERLAPIGRAAEILHDNEKHLYELIERGHFDGTGIVVRVAGKLRFNVRLLVQHIKHGGKGTPRHEA